MAAGRALFWLSVPWLFVPPAMLILTSEIKPVYVDRYVVFCLPALALLAGAGLAALGRYWRAAAVAVLVVAALPAQQSIRQPGGHGDDIRAAAQVLREQARPGDAVVWFKPGFRDLGAVYPYGFSRLRDIGLKDSATAAGNLSGTEVALPVLERRLRGMARVWLVEVDRDQPDPAVIGPRFQLIRVWRVRAFTFMLYRAVLVRGDTASPGSHPRTPDGLVRGFARAVAGPGMPAPRDRRIRAAVQTRGRRPRRSARL